MSKFGPEIPIDNRQFNEIIDRLGGKIIPVNPINAERQLLQGYILRGRLPKEWPSTKDGNYRDTCYCQHLEAVVPTQRGRFDICFSDGSIKADRGVICLKKCSDCVRDDVIVRRRLF